MSFDPFDPTTWREDPDDFVVPTHELESTITIAEADAEEQAQAQAFSWADAADTLVPEFGGPAFKEEVQDEAFRQIHKSRENLGSAVRARDPVLAQIEELKAQMRRLEKSRWHWPWSKKEA